MLSQPGRRPKDRFPRRIAFDIPPPPPKDKKERADYIKERKVTLDAALFASSYNKERICIVTDASCPPLPLQSVAFYRVWHDGDLYEDWSAAGLATSDDAELQAIARGICKGNLGYSRTSPKR